jgi:uncharacterized membrane protein YukC
VKDRKGFAGIIAAIFMVLIAIFLVFNVFMFTMERNGAFQDSVKQANQLILDKNNEQIVVNIPSRPIPSTNSITVPLDITDSSPLSIEIVSVWVQDLSMTSNPNYNCASTTIALQPGTTIVRNVIVSIAGAKSTDSDFNCWLITGRGNNVTIT